MPQLTYHSLIKEEDPGHKPVLAIFDFKLVRSLSLVRKDRFFITF